MQVFGRAGTNTSARASGIRIAFQKTNRQARFTP